MKKSIIIAIMMLATGLAGATDGKTQEIRKIYHGDGSLKSETPYVNGQNTESRKFTLETGA